MVGAACLTGLLVAAVVLAGGCAGGQAPAETRDSGFIVAASAPASAPLASTGAPPLEQARAWDGTVASHGSCEERVEGWRSQLLAQDIDAFRLPIPETLEPVVSRAGRRPPLGVTVALWADLAVVSMGEPLRSDDGAIAAALAATSAGSAAASSGQRLPVLVVLGRTADVTVAMRWLTKLAAGGARTYLLAATPDAGVVRPTARVGPIVAGPLLPYDLENSKLMRVYTSLSSSVRGCDDAIATFGEVAKSEPVPSKMAARFTDALIDARCRCDLDATLELTAWLFAGNRGFVAKEVKLQAGGQRLQLRAATAQELYDALPLDGAPTEVVR